MRDTLFTVTFEDTGKERHVLRFCKRCGVDADTFDVVSPRGTAHWGYFDGQTVCGIDATDDNWWWMI